MENQKDFFSDIKKSHLLEQTYVHHCEINLFMYVKETLTQVYTKDTKEKPFACGLCQKAFSRKDTFKTHLGTKSGEKHTLTINVLNTFRAMVV